MTSLQGRNWRKKMKEEIRRSKIMIGEEVPTSSPSRYGNYTSLNTKAENILKEIYNSWLLRFSPSIGKQAIPLNVNRSKKCEFYKSYESYTIEECIQLKDQIECLIYEGHLDQYLVKRRKCHSQDLHNWDDRQRSWSQSLRRGRDDQE